MKITGIDGLSPEQVRQLINDGGRFVVYQYCISILILTFRRSSNVFLIRKGESAASRNALFTAASLLLGWWGIPWGPIYTVSSVVNNLRGGKDVTQQVMGSLRE
jgi:hypothetical protein